MVYTLTRSPRSVALAKGPVPSVPSSWRSVTFGGIRLSVPARWLVEKESLFFLTCFSGPAEGYSLSHASVVLDSDVRVGVEGCVAAPSSAQPVRSPSNGLRIDTGPAFLSVQTFRFASGKCLDLHGLTACPATSPEYSILVLRVTVPGRTKPVFVSIGLAESGVIARTILYSLRPATSNMMPTGVVTGVSDACSNFATKGSPVRVVISAGPTVVASESLHLGGTYRFVVAPGVYRVTDYVSGTIYASTSVVVRSGRTVTFDFQCVVGT